MIRQDIIKNPDTDRLSVTYILNPGSGSRKSDISRGWCQGRRLGGVNVRWGPDGWHLTARYEFALKCHRSASGAYTSQVPLPTLGQPRNLTRHTRMQPRQEGCFSLMNEQSFLLSLLKGMLVDRPMLLRELKATRPCWVWQPELAVWLWQSCSVEVWKCELQKSNPEQETNTKKHQRCISKENTKNGWE